MEGNITINLKENGISTVCCISNDEEILFDLTEGEVELLRKIAVILISPEEVKEHVHKFLKFV
jgi:hypothetical protein